MKINNKLVQKLNKILLSAGLICAIYTIPAQADEMDLPVLQSINSIIQNISNNTDAILKNINIMFTYMTQLSTFAQTWLNADNTPGTNPDWSANWSNEQNALANLSNLTLQNESNQFSMQQQLLNNFFNLNTVNNNTLDNINDLSYTTLLNAPLITPDPRGNDVDSATNYLLNVSGLTLPLQQPDTNFNGSQSAQKTYTNFYNTITAVKTYNTFALSRLYLDSKNATNSNNLRNKLIAQSSNSQWFIDVISNDLGWVLRQILLYSSQNYILNDQLLQVAKQIAATAAMTNTLLIANSLTQSYTLLSSATGTNS